MSWPCYLVEANFYAYLFRLPGESEWTLQRSDLRPGAMWLDEDGELCVILPGGGSEWNVDRGRKYNEQKPSRNLPAWTRTGDLPKVTATPSINAIGTYHGWLRDGVLTDDCEGRTYAESGRLIK
jgi:hypothetical protein